MLRSQHLEDMLTNLKIVAFDSAKCKRCVPEKDEGRCNSASHPSESTVFNVSFVCCRKNKNNKRGLKHCISNFRCQNLESAVWLCCNYNCYPLCSPCLALQLQARVFGWCMGFRMCGEGMNKKAYLKRVAWSQLFW